MQTERIDVLNKLVENELHPGKISTADVSLGTGTAGIAIFYYYLYKYLEKKKFLARSQSLISTSVSALSHINQMSLSDGSFGIAWATDHLYKKEIISLDETEFYDVLDPAIYVTSLRAVMKGSYDYWRGGLGAVLHAFYRLPENKALGYLQQLVSIIESYKIVALFTKPQLVKELVNLISVLVGIDTRLFKGGGKEASLVVDSLNWLMDYLQRSTDAENSLFFELQLALLFCKAGKQYEQGEFSRFAMVIVQRMNTASQFKNDLNSVGLLEGASGVAYRWKTLYLETELECCKNEYEHWIDITINRLNGAGTFDQGLFTGSAGAGLVVIDYLHATEENDWAEFFLP